MCEINPKRKQFFRLEFFTSLPLTDDQWSALVMERLVLLEQAFNLEGKVRVHVHEELEFKVKVDMREFDPDGGEL